MDPEEYQRIAEAEERHWWYRATRSLAQQFLRPRLEPGSHLLDAGCGPGGNSSWWLDHGDVTGVDISSDAIALARERHPRMNAIRGDMTHLPLEDGTFDAVQILTVLYTVDDDRLALREVARVLKPGGAAFILEPANPRLRRDHDAVTHARRRYRLPGLVERTEEAGLGICAPATRTRSFFLRRWPSPSRTGLPLMTRAVSGQTFSATGWERSLRIWPAPSGGSSPGTTFRPGSRPSSSR